MVYSFTVPHHIAALQLFGQFLLTYFMFGAVGYSTYAAHLSCSVHSTLHTDWTFS